MVMFLEMYVLSFSKYALGRGIELEHKAGNELQGAFLLRDMGGVCVLKEFYYSLVGLRILVKGSRLPAFLAKM